MVHQLNVHTVGGVIAPPLVAAEAIMLIVPEADNLIVEAKVQPQDVDHCMLGNWPRCGSRHSINALRRNEWCGEHRVAGRYCGSEKA